MQQYNHSQTNIKIKFFILTEHISFLPTTIVNACQILRIERPSKEKYVELSSFLTNDKNKPYLQYISDFKNNKKSPILNKKISDVLNEIDISGIINTKEIRSFQLINSTEEIPKDVFNIICDNIIQEILNPNKISFTALRDTLYDILTYNLDMTECLWYILRFFIESNYLQKNDVSEILKRTYTFLKYYNNNYRPIYHLESIMFYIINKIHNFNEL
jgi:hypothetical protein